jgi:hypothetical protein
VGESGVTALLSRLAQGAKNKTVWNRRMLNGLG